MDYLTIRACLNLPETLALDRQPHHKTVSLAITEGKLPAIKPGQDYLIKRDDYLTWLDGFPYKPGRKPE